MCHVLIAFVLGLAFLASCAETEPASEVTLGETIGVNTHYAGGGAVDPEGLARLARAGVRFIRNDLTWASIEKERGSYDFAGSGFDVLVSAAEEEGLGILFILDYGNPLYGPPRAVVDDDGRRAFAAFATAAAERYGGRGHRWEIWNEPNLAQFWSSASSGPDPERYTALVRSTVPALRAADPSAEILVGALFFLFPQVIETLDLGIGGPRFLEDMAAAGALADVDGVTLHLYRFGGPETVAAEIAMARDILDRAGVPLPLSSGEWGYSTYDANVPPTGVNYLPAVSLERQASYVARMLLTNYSLGIQRSVIYDDRDPGDPEPGNIEHHFGLLFEDLSPKPAIEALTTLTTLLGDAGPPDVLALGSGEHGLLFHPPGGLPTVALWSEQQTAWMLHGDDQSRILSRDGRDVTPADLPHGVRWSLAPDDGPIYVLGDVTITSTEQRE